MNDSKPYFINPTAAADADAAALWNYTQERVLKQQTWRRNERKTHLLINKQNHLDQNRFSTQTDN